MTQHMLKSLDVLTSELNLLHKGASPLAMKTFLRVVWESRWGASVCGSDDNWINGFGQVV